MSKTSCDILETCLRTMLQDYLQAKIEIKTKDIEKVEELEHLRKQTGQYKATLLMHDSLKQDLKSMEEELEVRERLIRKTKNERQEVDAKLNRSKEDVLMERANCQQLEKEKLSYKNEMENLKQRIHLAEDEKDKSLRVLLETEKQLALAENELKKIQEDWEAKSHSLKLLELETEELKTFNNQLQEENQRIIDMEKKYLESEETIAMLMAELEEKERIIGFVEKGAGYIEENHEYVSKETAPRNESSMQCRNEMQTEMNVENKQNEVTESLEEESQLDSIDGTYNLNHCLISQEEEDNISMREKLAITNNLQFLMENINSVRVLNLLYLKGCLTEDRRDNINIQPGNFYRNGELLYWMKSTEFSRSHWTIFLQCLHETGQNVIADFLEKGAVAVKSKISSTLGTPTKLIMLSKSKIRDMTKEKEKSIVELLNQSDQLSTTKFGTDQKSISEILGDGIDIAPFCCREDDGIVIWFLCNSQISLGKLQEMYASGNLLSEKLELIFRNLSRETSSFSSNSVLIPKTLTMFMEDFRRTRELVGYAWMYPKLLVTMKTDAAQKNHAGIYGLTILDFEIFVVSSQCSVVEVYNKNSLCFQRSFIVENLKEPRDIVSCGKNMRLYIVDGNTLGEPMSILAADLQGNIIKKLWTGNDWGRLSVTKESNILLAVLDKSKLMEISPNGYLIREIKLSVPNPWHAVQTENGHFVVTYGRKGGVCIVDANGSVILSPHSCYDELLQLVKVPICVSIDRTGSVFVVDEYGGRILLLTSTLQYQKELVTRTHGLKFPRRMFLDRSIDRLFVADNEIISNIGCIRVYDFCEH